MTPTCVGCIALMNLADAKAVTPAFLIGPDLDDQPVSIVAFMDDTLTYFDRDRILQSEPAESLVRLHHIADTTPIDLPAPSLTLTDGQCFTGIWVGPSPQGDGLRWRHDRLNTLTVSLDRVSRIVWDAANIPSLNDMELPPSSDTLRLINGDALIGFVTGLNDKGVELLTDSSNEPVTIPYSRIAWLAMANPLQDRGSYEHLLTLADGTRVYVSDLRIADEIIKGSAEIPGDASVTFEWPMSELAQIDFGSGSYRIIPLNRLLLRESSAGEVFGLRLPVRTDSQTVRMHAPASLTYELPEGAVRFAAEAELDVQDAPDDIDRWADFDLVLINGGQEIGRWRINGKQPRVRVQAPLLGSDLTIRLETGINGPILDRLRLTRAVVLVDEKTAERLDRPKPR